MHLPETGRLSRNFLLHGPVEQNHYDIAHAMASTLGHPVHYDLICVEEFASAMLTDRFGMRFGVVSSG